MSLEECERQNKILRDKLKEMAGITNGQINEMFVMAPKPDNILPGNYATIDALNKQIGDLYGVKPNAQNTISRTVVRKKELYTRFPIAEKKGLELVLTSAGKGNDCLIQAFLTSTCPNFRKISQARRDEFGSSFRREFLPTIDKNYWKGGEAELNTRQPLATDLHLSGLCDYYNINFAVFEVVPGIGTFQLTEYGANEAPSKIPGNIPGIKNDTGYLMFNPDGVHYEAIRTGDGKFTFSRKEIKDMREVSLDPSLKPLTLINQTLPVISDPKPLYQNGENKAEYVQILAAWYKRNPSKIPKTGGRTRRRGRRSRRA